MSASSEIVDSGRFSGHKMPEKTNFSQTFTLLNQYLKENGSFGDLNLGMAKSASATMNLFPAAEKSPADGVSKQQVSKKLPESAQMTIFYAGQVIVLNDFPADKAMEIMTLAGKGTYQPASSLAASQHKNIDKEGLQLHRPQPVVSDLPIARKASLTRFLEKRKERITARAPYQSEKQDDGKAWLGLAATQSGTQS